MSLRLGYNLLLLAALIALSPVWIAWLVLRPGLRVGLRERLRPLEPQPGQPIWIHAASVGEVEAAAPLIAALAQRGEPLVATCLTASGRERLRTLAPGSQPRLAPLDLPWLVGRSLEQSRARQLVLVETELWPNLIWEAHARGIRVALVAGRISDSGLAGYQRARRLYASLLRAVSAIGARSAQDRERFLDLGADPSTCSVSGDLKLARGVPPAPDAELAEVLGRRPLLVAGSTHPGEDTALVSAWRELRSGAAPDLRLVIAPRHLERVDALCVQLARLGIAAGRRSQRSRDCDVLVLDTHGELAACYRVASLVFVGGTLVPVGGHNLLEPVLAGHVAVHGPHVENQRAQRELLDPLGVLYAAPDAAGLAAVLGSLWADPRRDAPARAARKALDASAVVAASLRVVLGREPTVA